MDNEQFTPNSNSSNNNSQDVDSKLNPTMPPVRAAFLAVFAVFLLYQFGGGLLVLIIFGFDIENADINALRLLTMGGQVLFILLPALWFSKVIYEDVSTVLRIRMPNIKEIITFIIGLIILFPLLQSYLYIQNYVIDQLAQSSSFINDLKILLDEFDVYIEETYGDLIKAKNIFELFLIIVVVAITPAICEEVFFRGFVQKSFELQMRPWLGILLTAAFFGLYHFNPYGLIALITLGAYFGFAAYLSNSIIIPVLLHFINNFFQILVYYILDTEEFSNPGVISTETFQTQFMNFAILLVLFFVFFYFVRKYYYIIRGEQNDLSKV